MGVMGLMLLVLAGLLLLGGVAAALAVVTGRQRDAALRAAVDTLTSIQREGMVAQATVGAEQLDGKKALIDRELEAVREQTERLEALVRELEAGREHKLGVLSEQLDRQHEGLSSLLQTTQSLREALSNTTARGQWGERMAEDVLRLAGFVEGVQYRKQRALESGGVPDFTFLLPQELCLHMDVKFPLDNYLRLLEAGSEIERERHRKAFLKDVRDRVKELARRDYVDAESVECVLLFIPNEQVYAFIQEQDRELLDEALRHQVVFCSPLTLFAVLAVVRQAVDNFRLERTSKEILELLHGFGRQWDKFTEQMEKVGRNLKTAGNAFEELQGTRRTQLERELHRIDALRSRALGEEEGDDADPPALRALEA
jgi:DNA recombination protein RmuC